MEFKPINCQGKFFDTETSLISFLETISPDSAYFLKDWFNPCLDYIKVKTSGSTGEPKLFLVKKKDMVASAIATGNFFKLGRATSVLSCLSSNHIAGKMMWVRALVLGWDLHIAPSCLQPLKSIREKFDFTAMVPLQVQSSLQDIDKKVKKILIGGAPVSSELTCKLQDIKTEAFVGYGMTETISHVAIRRLNYIKNYNTQDYQALEGIAFSMDSRGCLEISSKRLPKYKTVTNDLVELTSKISFKWLGRYDSVINTGGIKVIPEQIEDKIKPHITERFFIYGIDDQVLGQRVVICIEKKEFNQWTYRNINQFKSSVLSLIKKIDGLSKYQIPKDVYLYPTFIETSTKKIKRKATVCKQL